MKIQLKRSNVLENNAAKEPTAPQMEYGELAVNYNTDDPAIFIKDSNNNIIRIAGVNNISDDGQVEIPSNITPPSDPLPGNLWYNPVDGRLYVYYDDGNSQQWVDASPDNWNPTVIPDPDGGDNQPGTLDDRYVKKIGDNMTGDLTLGTDQITLNATDGTSYFRRALRLGLYDLSSTDVSGARLRDSGALYLQGSQNYTVNENAQRIYYGNTLTQLSQLDGSIKIGGTLPSAPNIKLNSDGSAHFKSGDQDTLSSVVISNDGSVSNGYVSLWNNGTNNAGVGINGSGTASNIGLYLNHAGTRNFSVAYDGSGTFAGNVNVNNGTQVHLSRPNGTQTQFVQAGDMALNIRSGTNNDSGQKFAVSGTGNLTSKGSATFAGSVSTNFLNVNAPGLTSGANKICNFSTGVVTDAIVFWANGNATYVGTINGATVGTSDARFKENITPAKPQLADVVALGGILKNYDWNDDAPVNDELRAQRHLGLVAQEVAEICPSLVKDINRTKTMEITPAVIGPKGKVIKEAVTEEVDDSYKGLSQDALIMKLIGAVAELSAEVQALKNAA